MFVHLSCFGRLEKDGCSEVFCTISIIPQTYPVFPIPESLNQVQKPEMPEKILKQVSHNCQRLKEKMDSFRTPKVGIEPPGSTTEPTDSSAKQAGTEGASTTSKTLGESMAPFGQVDEVTKIPKG